MANFFKTFPSKGIIFYTVFSKRMLIAFLMGFYSGLPLLLTGSVLQAWMREDGVDLTTIGLFALAGLPYTVKFLWAPFIDRFIPSFLGRRRGWLLIIQICLSLAIAALGCFQPAVHPGYVALSALVVTFFSATQDIIVDAYRREALSDDEQGLGASFYVNGYRLGMLLASGGGLILADFISFTQVYSLLAVIMLTGVVTTLFAAEPPTPPRCPQTLTEAVIQPFTEFFKKQDAALILLFILLYKLGDTMANHMSIPFYLDLGYQKTEIGTVVKLFGFWATILGGFIGGACILRTGIYPALWGFGVLQALSTAGFAALAQIGPSLGGLVVVISFENLSAGMGTAAFIAFMATQTDKRFTATQYALLSSLMGIPRVLIAAPTGWMATVMGWQTFFLFCSILAAPGMLLLLRFRSWLKAPAKATAT